MTPLAKCATVLKNPIVCKGTIQKVELKITLDFFIEHHRLSHWFQSKSYMYHYDDIVKCGLDYTRRARWPFRAFCVDDPNQIT